MAAPRDDRAGPGPGPEVPRRARIELTAAGPGGPERARPGPILVEGPIELVLPDGRRVSSDRPVVAICACRRSRHYPFCDTSHRQRGPADDPLADDPLADDPLADDRGEDPLADDPLADDRGEVLGPEGQDGA